MCHWRPSARDNGRIPKKLQSRRRRSAQPHKDWNAMLHFPEPVMQRTSGKGNLLVRRRNGQSVVGKVFQEGAARICFPRQHGSKSIEAVLINTAGGLTGGDRMEWYVDAAEQSVLTLTTQACEKVYRSAGGEAKVAVRLKAESGAHINWLPQETIIFDQARLDRRLDVNLESEASLLAAEAVVFGRLARGEIVRSVFFRDRWRVSCGGRLVHCEDQSLTGNAKDLLAPAASADGAAAMATVLLVASDATERIEDARRLLAGFPEIASGTSAWSVAATGKLLARLVGKDSYTLRKALIPLLSLLNSKAPMPKIWTM